ncbi:MAG: MBL fold metallo-hydrolase [Chloroflexi bacterium]|jgi:beta-lactamase superfamily II metal-dependent hydrolase|nr:MBL fold metallo-hydrolase [Chloroflexota bacterium]
MNKYFHSCNPKRLICLAAVLISFIFLFVPQNEGVAAQAQNALFVTFIDVGQGDCSLLRTSNGTNILIDAGPTSTGQAVLSNLYDQGVSSLDVIIISHNHEDHIGGLLTIFQSEIQAGRFYTMEVIVQLQPA